MKSATDSDLISAIPIEVGHPWRGGKRSTAGRVLGALLVRNDERGDRCQPRECRCDVYVRSCA